LSRRELTDLAADDKFIHIYDDTMEVAFAYDGAGNRIRKMSIINDDTTIVKYSYDGPDLLFEHDDTDAVVVRYLYGPGIDNILETETDGGDYLHFADGLGSVAKITNSSGDVLKTMRYDTFGNFIADSGSADGDYVSFTGREYDGLFGLYYYRARYYSPMTGRFTTRDPIGLAGGDVNLYKYTGNRPNNFIDPYGLKTWRILVESAAYGWYPFSFETGTYLLIDPVTNEYTAFGYFSPGVGFGFGGAAQVEFGLLEGNEDPMAISHWGLAISGFISIGAGGSAQIFGTSFWGQELGGSIGIAPGYGAGISGLVTYSWYTDKGSIIPDKYRDLYEKYFGRNKCK